MLLNSKTTTIFLSVILLLLILGRVTAQNDIVELKFARPPDTGSDTARTLQSLIKVQGTGQFCQDGLYLMTHFGNREEIFRKENQEMIDNPLLNKTWRHCSLFSSSAEKSFIMGRNWDNQTVGSIIVNLYHPPNGYASISFTRSIDMDFGHKDLEALISSPFENKLLLAPFYAYDGINEHGLAVGIAGNRETAVEPKNDKELIFVPFLVRKILDQTKNIEEAVALVEKFAPFDIAKNSLNSHLFIVDSKGKSVVLEYAEDQWKKIYGKGNWQAMSTKPVHNVPDEVLREGCWRYKRMSESLEQAKGKVDWKAGMKILQNVKQKGTTWSVVYSLTTKELFISVYQNWDTIYHLTMS